MEHEFDRPAEVEELEQKKTDSVEEEKTTASEKKAESQRAAEIGYGWGPDLLPLPPAPLPKDIQADKEREALKQEFSGRRSSKRPKQKTQQGGQERAADDSGAQRLQPAPLPGELKSPLDPAEEARMNELIYALFAQKDSSAPAESAPAEKEDAQPKQEEAPAATKAEPPEETAREEADAAPKAEKSRKKKRAEENQPEKKKKQRPKVQWAEEEEDDHLLRRLRQQWNEVEASSGSEGQSGKQKVQVIWDHLMDQADEYAQTMYEEEQQESAEKQPHWADQYRNVQIFDQEASPGQKEQKAEQYEDPWGEEEEDWDDDDRPLPQKKHKRRRWFRLHEEPNEEEPDFEYTPGEVANFYRKRLGKLRMRAVVTGIFAFLLCYTALAQQYGWPFPFAGQGGLTYFIGASLLFLCLAALFGFEVIRDGIKGLFTAKADIELLVAVSVIASALDAFTMLAFKFRTATMPFCAVSGVSLFFAMWSRYSKIKSKRMAYRVASLSSPSLVTRNTEKWENGKCFTKHLGSVRGFVTQVESADGIERLYRPLAPLLFLAALLFGLLVAVGKSEPKLFIWSVSAMAAASASFSACFGYSMPYARLTRRLMGRGAALAGWPGVSSIGGQNGIALSDRDLFPTGMVEVTEMNVVGSHTEDTVITCTASVLMESGCGLDKTFHELLRRRGMIFRRPEGLSQYEAGGFSGAVQGRSVLVGSKALMQEFGIPINQQELPQYAVFCAIDGHLAGIFTLKYRISRGVKRGLSQLLRNRLSPVIATRDFYVTPQMLSRRAKVKAADFSYPGMEERMALSDPKQDYELPIVAVLVREGLTPFAEAIVGGRRLRRAVRAGAVIAAINSVLGLLFAFYLTYVHAFASITVLNLLIFMAMWLVPAMLVARGANRY